MPTLKPTSDNLLGRHTDTEPSTLMQPIERVSQTDRVVKELTRHFLSDAIREGEKLPTEMELCERLRVGRSTVREAIKALQVMGYVEIRPGRGAYLQRKSLDVPVRSNLSWLGSRKAEVSEIIEVRMQLEPFAARLAAERASDEDIARIDAIRVEYEDTLGSGPFCDAIGEQLGLLDARLHTAIAEAAKNALLVDLNNVVIEAFREFRTRTFKVENHARNAVAPHRRIVASLQKRDVAAAQRDMKNHMFKTLEDISLGAGE
jgi:GntR family transcriptional regulator, transcriptional repressor for pyruvate dehydrogenase complex